ncbi:hypothetical protein, partial [Anaerobacillus sp. 1_MG-2023]|uniref:hypothetical protein n=1 Tax=Anaerobacillus sp. 1_MG-2023 TaxID=3062655 RepID=UPI0026E467EF
MKTKLSLYLLIFCLIFQPAISGLGGSLNTEAAGEDVFSQVTLMDDKQQKIDENIEVDPTSSGEVIIDWQTTPDQVTEQNAFSIKLPRQIQAPANEGELSKDDGTLAGTYSTENGKLVVTLSEVTSEQAGSIALPFTWNEDKIGNQPDHTLSFITDSGKVMDLPVLFSLEKSKGSKVEETSTSQSDESTEN